ncbi:hypothetical protein TRVA0_027S00342 [Trichomonascus vanleenenianus]|uniref:kinetochore-associated Ndc80 complex subunit SPC25 n=1 Tax=Trichomonascus vanleenenianus TaxID=2268995 RepID=UPI003EC9CA5A
MENGNVGITQVAKPDLQADKLRKRMDAFRSQFDGYIGASRQKVLDMRNEHARALSDARESQKELSNEIEELNRREVEIANARAKDQRELEESRSAIATYAAKRDGVKSSNDQLLDQIAELRRQIQSRREEKNNQQQHLTKQTSLNAPELAFWERILGLRIEGASEDFIKFAFTLIDPSDVDKEYYFIVDLRSHDYAVSECNPPLDEEVLNKIVDDLNESRRLNLFLRDMRRAFKNLNL